MVVKPTGNAGWFWGMLVAMLAGIAVVIALTGRSGRFVGAAAPDSPSAG
jgi:hypothetical protein